MRVFSQGEWNSSCNSARLAKILFRRDPLREPQFKFLQSGVIATRWTRRDGPIFFRAKSPIYLCVPNSLLSGPPT